MNLAIVGATGAVGREMCAILEQRGFEFDSLKLLASPRSAGTTVEVCGAELHVEAISTTALQGVDIALFSAGSGVTKEFATQFRGGKAVLIDNSSAYRLDPEVPLVVPEINALAAQQHNGIVANPNCTTIILAICLFPLHTQNPIQRVIVSTYQAASGAGAAAMAELQQQSKDVLDGKPANPKIFARQCAFNLFSHDSDIDDSGYNEEERKVTNELRKIFSEPQLRAAATCVRVPVFRAHSESVTVTFENPIQPQAVREILSRAPGVRLVDDVESNYFPMPIEASGADDVLVGRIRSDVSDPSGCSISLFLSGDQLRKGAALNAVQIAELFTSN